ncbi:MAG: hypothetical protein DDT23_00976 [candidate division WS2 bacterium]|nr:hypothetical protein [Candidatus Lithacetigena glycinireducens]
MIDTELLEILACPICKGSVELRGDKIICHQCKKYYPIEDGIPIMLVDRARPLEQHEQA